MKKYFGLLSMFIVFSIPAVAQTEIRNPDGSYYKQCKKFSISRPLSELIKELPQKSIEKRAPHEAHDAARKHPGNHPSSMPFSKDPVRQKQAGAKSIEAPIQNFDGQTSIDGYVPLDPTGAVGLNHYVQSVNSNYQIFDKNGNALTQPVDLSGLLTGSSDQGDPIVMYDKFADRWVITEFETDSPPLGNLNELIFAVSTSPDPLGTYYLYTFEPDATDYADYPKYSIWWDGYYETCNCDNQKVTVYDRNKMLNGDTTAGFIVIPTFANPNGGFWCPQTLFADGELPPDGSPQYFFYFTDDNWGNGLQDKIVIYKITTNWANHTGTFTLDNSLTPEPFTSYFTGGTYEDISQPGTNNKLDALDGFFAYRIPYMRWDGYNSAVMCNSVNVGTGGTIQSGIRWYEFRQDSASQAWSIFQQGTFAPADGINRWNPSIAMDMNGSIGLAYSASSSSVYPGVRYTGRTKCDSAGIMSMSEGIAVSGTAAYTGQDHRWGDYSHTTLDPEDGGLTFWHTNQYVVSGGDLNTRIFSFQVPACSATGVTSLSEKSEDIKLTFFQQGGYLNVKAEHLPATNYVDLGLYSIDGKLVAKQVFNVPAGKVETSFNVADLPKAFYFLRLSSYNFQRVVKVVIH